MKEITIIGTFHHDLVGRARLQTALHHIVQRHGCPPSFVGVEFAQPVYQVIIEQKKLVAQQIRTQLPGYIDSISEALADTTAFEATVVLEMFPGAKIVWLDEGVPRYDQPTEKILASFRITKMNECIDVLSDSHVPKNATLTKARECIGNYYARESRELAVVQIDDYEVYHKYIEVMLIKPRDEIWCTKLRDIMIDESDKSWYGIVIVGAHHLLEHNLIGKPSAVYQMLVEAGNMRMDRIWPHEFDND